ncbi:MAG: hypothetical protein BWK75_04450 [Candidatus Altiarchaeales archaeon A3]|nr:MAG: hypothetical protein BWK75_04450 [Candidatus Altiarchaeales archaeon A3]
MKSGNLSITGIIILISVIFLSGCLENAETELPDKNTANLTPENLKTEIINTIDSIKFYQYTVSVEEKYMLNAEDFYYNWIVAGHSDMENKILSFDYTLKDEYGAVFDGVESYNIKDTLYFSHNVRAHKKCRGGWIRGCSTTLKGVYPFTTQLSEDWGREDEMAIPFKISDSLSAMKEILSNSDIKILSEGEKWLKIEIHPNDAGKEILIRHAEITYKTGGTTYADDFESVCNNIVGGMKNLTLIMYADKKTLAINKIYVEGTFKGVYGKSTLTVNENLVDFNKKINIEIPKEVEEDVKKR